MKNSMFICFIGIDGSGKTTLAQSVLHTLSRQEVGFQYVHGLIRPILMKPFMIVGRFLFAHGKSRESNYSEFVTAKRSRLSKYPALSFLYQVLLFLDYFPQAFWKITLPLFFGKRIISDRYIYDIIVNMSVNIGFDLNKAIRAIEIYFQILPKPDVVFLVDVPEEVSLSRKEDVPSIEYLHERRYIYQELAKAFDMMIVNGTMTIEDLTMIVLKTIRRGQS